MGFATFGAALTAILRDVGGQMQIAEARICREWPEACLTIGINRYEAPKAVHWFGHQDLAETRAAGFRTMLAVPMLQGGKPIGVVGVSRKHPGPFAAELVRHRIERRKPSVEQRCPRNVHDHAERRVITQDAQDVDDA